MPKRRRFNPGNWLGCGLALVLLASLCVTRVAGQTTGANAVAAQTQPTPRDDYERLPFMEPARQADEAAAPSAAGLLARTLGALLLIVSLLAGAAWGLRRFGGAQFGVPATDAPELSVLTTVSLGDRRSLSAVRFGNRLLLVGSTAQAITLLAAKKRKPRPTAPPMRSVADLLAEADPPDFEQALNRAKQQLKQRPNTKTL